MASSFPAVPQVLADFAQKRMARNLMATSPLFQRMPESERAALLQRFSFRALQPGEKVLVEGEHSPGLFLVLAGELVVQKEDPAGGVVRLGVLREGEVAGEISLLTGLRATATVVATRKTATAFLERAAFDELVKDLSAHEDVPGAALGSPAEADRRGAASRGDPRRRRAGHGERRHRGG